MLAQFLSSLMEHPRIGGMKIFFKWSHSLVQFDYHAHIGKRHKILLQNQESLEVESRYIALEIRDLPDLFK